MLITARLLKVRLNYNIRSVKLGKASKHQSLFFEVVKSAMSQNKFDAKVVILGSESSGKTCLAQRFLNDRFVGDGKYQVKFQSLLEKGYFKDAC